MFTHTHRVRYHEVDQQGYLFNGHFFEIADVGLVEYFRALGWTYPQLNKLGFDPSVVKAEAEFLKPARYDAELQVEVTCLRVGTSSFTLRTRITEHEGVVAQLTLVHVNVDATTGVSRPVPKTIAEALRAQLGSQGHGQSE